MDPSRKQGGTHQGESHGVEVATTTAWSVAGVISVIAEGCGLWRHVYEYVVAAMLAGRSCCGHACFLVMRKTSNLLEMITENGHSPCC